MYGRKRHLKKNKNKNKNDQNRNKRTRCIGAEPDQGYGCPVEVSHTRAVEVVRANTAGWFAGLGVLKRKQFGVYSIRRMK